MPSSVTCLKRTSTTSDGSTQTMPGPRSVSATTGGGRARAEAIEPAAELAEQLVGEPGADAPDVDQAVGPHRRELERAQVRARALGQRVADDGEIGGVLDADLQPRRRPPRDVRAVGALGHHALEPERLDLPPQREAVGLDVIGVANRARRWQHREEKALALRQRQSAQVEVLEAEQIERVEHDRVITHRGLDVARAQQQRPLLQAREVGPRVVVEHDHLAVEHEPGVGQERGGPRHFGVQLGCLRTPSIHKTALAVLDYDEQAIAVVLEFVEKRRIRETAPSRPLRA
jgi:hypothetical protein